MRNNPAAAARTPVVFAKCTPAGARRSAVMAAATMGQEMKPREMSIPTVACTPVISPADPAIWRKTRHRGSAGGQYDDSISSSNGCINGEITILCLPRANLHKTRC
jgi:hypothetical protein